ncbi:testis-specific Y-encoded-like protein 5 isoform X2 [Fukomys damarensis]|uniref:Testis-specific Y-encoded-like protein 5 n=1 Tax=Fukomys damarensis TaxID=885580 RepID=A0A091EIG3_FUKDA|nr:testis-specific Y-encoded-like protein 5 isoform X1 [Fukomys damarensis]XP_010617886.1 testis-specific Y-encoded-like protein 5 isoform X2 [Fukomys damarensis]KFO35251.1 Testis-specific Y-encoded-like protein 5 [Fukomys damarensis]
MSGRSRGRKSSRAKSRGKGRAKARVRAVPDIASRDPDPPQCQSPGEDTQVAQVQASARGGGSKAAAPAQPLQLGDEDLDPCRLPLDCGLALRAQAAGERALAATRPGPGRALSCSERLAADTVFVGSVGTVARPKLGPCAGTRCGSAGKKVPEKSCSSEGRASQALDGGKPKKGPTEECTPIPGEEERKVAETHSSSGPVAPAGNMDTLETVQLKLETMNAQADRAYLRLSRKFGQLRLYHLERRNTLIQNIPGFWGLAFQNHPQLSSFLNSQDKEVLSYLNRLEVEELGLARLGYKIKFYFGRNPYFQNKVLIKEYGCGPSGQVISRSTPIQWLPGHDLHSVCQGNPEKKRSFFGWFVNHTSIESDKIVEIINEELWPNPLQYYLLSEGARGEKGKEGRPGTAKQPVETPQPEVKPPK